MNSTVNKFNNHYQNLINELNNIYPELQLSNMKINLEDAQYLEMFKESIKQYYDLIINYDLSILTKPIIPNINLETILINDETKQVIFKYLLVLFIQSFRYNKTKEELNLIIKNKTQYRQQKEYETFFVSLQHLKNYQSQKQTTTTTNEQPTMNNMKEFNNDIMSSQIGKMAMNIAKDIDMSKFELDKPEQMLRNLMSGNISQNKNLQSLINTVSSKITEQFSSGELNTTDVVKDATKLFNNPLFKNMSNLSQNVTNNTTIPDMTDLSSIQEQIKEHIEQQTNNIDSVESNETTESVVKEDLIANLQKMKKKYLKKKINNLLKK